MRCLGLEKREARVYYVQEREGQKAILVFDGGHANGDIHVYEHVKSCSTKDVQEEVKTYLKAHNFPKGSEFTILSTWVEKNFGFPISWRLTEE
jgi:hypothetical protein